MADPEALGDMEQQAQQAAAAASAEQALAVAFAGLLCDDSKLLQEAPAEPAGLTVLYEVRATRCTSSSWLCTVCCNDAALNHAAMWHVAASGRRGTSENSTQQHDARFVCLVVAGG